MLRFGLRKIMTIAVIVTAISVGFDCFRIAVLAA